jgi:hypothetical protein
MKIVSEFSEFVTACADVADADRTDIRYGTRSAGSVAIQLLNQVRPDLSELIEGSDFDPRKSDARFPLFFDFVMRHWDD